METKSKYTNKDTIFVQIASYRDPELQHTLQDLYKKAKKPENIFVGICHQYDMQSDTDKHLFEVPFPRPEQIRFDNVHYSESKGCAWARNRAQKLYNGEKWVLWLDSHHRFIENWDEELVNILKPLGDLSVLTHFAPNYNKETGEGSDILWSGQVGSGLSKNFTYLVDKKRLNYGNVCCLHFLFTLAKNIDFEVNPDLKSWDELPLSVLLWRKGCNIFICNKIILWHYIPPNDDQKKEMKSKTESKTLNYSSYIDDIFRTYLCSKKINNIDILNLVKKHSPSSFKRSIRDYERFVGIDYRKGKMRERAVLGAFEKWIEVTKVNEIKNIFKKL